MFFTNPENVLSPKANVQNVRVLSNTGEDGWSLAELFWDNRPVLGIRWNGGKSNPLGNPQSRGVPMWFVLPDAIAEILRTHLVSSTYNFDELPSDINRIKIRPLPKRIWQKKLQEPADYTWVVEHIDQTQGIITISGPTGHVLPLYRAHIRRLIPDMVTPDSAGMKTGILELSVQMVFEDGHPRLEVGPLG